LEHVLNEIRDSTQRHPDETIDEFMKRTWHLALMRLEQEKPSEGVGTPERKVEE
jgi:hypothetical protein